MNETPFIIALVIIAAIWGVYYFSNRTSGGGRVAPIASTQRFDQWTHVVADVQRRVYSVDRERNLIRSRRRRALAGLITAAVATLLAAVLMASMNWLLLSLAVDAVLAWFVAMLLQVKERQANRVASRHLSTRPSQSDDVKVRIVANS